MNLRSKLRFYKKVAFLLCCIMVWESAIYPITAFALTSGPTQPEFSSFEPVSTTNMVNEFSGGFTYNLPVLQVPGANGGGYAVSLSYHSGASPEEEASWVGYGWTLNPGAINRAKRGLADDNNGANIKYWNKMPTDWTVSVGGSVAAELFSYNIPGSLSASLRYNNYKGFGYTAGVGISVVKGFGNLGFNISDGKGSFSASLNPVGGFMKIKADKAKTAEEKSKAKKEKESPARKQQAMFKALAATDKQKAKEARRKAKTERSMGFGQINLIGSQYGIFSHGDAVRPTNISSYSGASFNLSVGVMATLIPAQIGPSFDITGSFSWRKNTESEDLPTYGYMYSDGAGTSSIMDYYVEKENPYDKQDIYLGIPFNNADSYSVTGEGLGGGFRMYNKKPGHYRPNHKNSSVVIANVGLEVEAGLDIGGGGNLGVGAQTFDVFDWPSDLQGNTFNYTFAAGADADEPTMMRFSGDLAGNVMYGGEELVSAKLNGKTLSLPSSLIQERNNGERAGRSSYLAFHTNAEMAEKVYSATLQKDVNYRSYTKDASSRQHVERTTDNSIKDGIGEIVSFNEEGSRYVYGLPVYSKNEVNLQYGLEGAAAGSIDNKYLAYKDISNDNNLKIKVGQEDNNPYATTYLLTEITNSDYVDRTMDGPTPDDFGGYTKFNYTQVHGTNSSGDKTTGSWYKWRIPYTGLSYSRNELSDPSDDMGAVMAGEKEIYYLESIETKTHIARFITSLRDDGIEADDNNTAANSRTAKGANQLKKLDRIELYAKGENGSPEKLVKTVHFAYDYSLIQGTPNSVAGTKGRLTLKKVWFEYEGIVNAKISPYRFSYEYANHGYPARYSALDNYADADRNGAAFEQNPDYSPFSLDMWGNYQYNGHLRHDRMIPWVDQTPDTDKFDPAAWQLKRIQLPSGGEIHVQYEQNDYSYVQDKRAMAMVSLKPSSLTGVDTRLDLNKYYLNVGEELGITSSSELARLKDLISEEFNSEEKKIYFKFLYRLKGVTPPELEHCNAEYITGYASVKEVGIEGNDIYIILGRAGVFSEKYDLPKQVCKDYVKTNRNGKIVLDGVNGKCDGSDGVPNDNNAKNTVMSFLNFIVSITPYDDATICAYMKPEESYLRIPMTKAKKGGGVRVKRILMFDQGIETGDASLYGSEYIYETEDEKTGHIISSGVATNEPAEGREENALVTFLAKDKQTFLNRIIAGRDKEQAEGPLGESLLPGPSIGYSKIIVKNIHSGKTNTGFSVNEYYTVKDFPFRHEVGDLDEKNEYIPIPAGLVNIFINNAWAAQGYKFIINEMHGQPKRLATYSGDYSDIHNPDKNILSSLQEFNYFKPGEEIPMMYDIEDIRYKSAGKEVEIAFERKAVEDIVEEMGVEWDADVGVFFIPPIYATAFPHLTYNETKLRTHVTSKVIRYPVIQKSVLTYQDGIYHFSVNKAFNPETGKPALVKTSDGFNRLALEQAAQQDGNYHSYTFPASLQYREMGQKALNEGLKIKSPHNGVTISKVIDGGNYFLEFTVPPASSTSVCDAMNTFIKGDLVKLTLLNPAVTVGCKPGSSEHNPNDFYNIGPVEGSRIRIYPSYTHSYNEHCDGEVDIEVIRSGRTNQLSAVAGSITTYGTPPAIQTIPIDAVILGPRQQLVNALNTMISPGGHIKDSIDGQYLRDLAIIDPQLKTCSPLGVNVLVDFNQPTGQGGIILARKEAKGIIGDPTNPHPMVKALNNYLKKYFGYALSPGVPASEIPRDCGTLTNPDGSTLEFEDASDLNASVADMRTKQTADLGKSYDNINCGIHSISEYFTDAGDNINDYTNTVLAVPASLSEGDVELVSKEKRSRTNRAVILKYGFLQFGAYVKCEANPADNKICIVQNGADDICIPYKDFLANPDLGKFYQTADGYLAYQYGSTDPTITNIRFVTCTVPCEGESAILCTSSFTIPTSGSIGEFKVDPLTGEIGYYRPQNPCYPQPVNCLELCPKAYQVKALQKVVASDAKSFHDYWVFNPDGYGAPDMRNPYECGVAGKWRVKSQYAFNTTISGINAQTASTARNYNSGIYTLDLFNWKNENSNNPGKWLKLNTVTKYSPNGDALEEKNILGVYSAAKFGYNQVLPVLVSQNAEHSSVFFESFEKSYSASGGNYFENGLPDNSSNGTAVSSTAHSGERSLKLSNDVNGLDLPLIPVSSQVYEQGLTMKVWVKTSTSNLDNVQGRLKAEIRQEGVFSGTPLGSQNFVKVAQIGEWTLYSVNVALKNYYAAPNSGTPFNAALYIKYHFAGSEDVWLDDLRIQPTDAQMITYVYDMNTLRLMASFDDQHFGLFYQYNAEGKLVRKIIETEKGMKTLQETQYNTPQVTRTP